MYEHSPAYFQQFQKNFRFFVSDEKPSSLFAKNYAVCMQFENGYCEVLPSNPYHVLFDMSDVSTELLKRISFMQFLVCIQPSIFFSNGATVEVTGEVIEKLKLAVEYNGSAPLTKGDATATQKRLPNLSNAPSKYHCQNGIVAYKSLENAEKTLNQQMQSDWLSTETLKRFENFLYGPHAGAFYQKLDLFMSGYGKLDIDNEVL